MVRALKRIISADCRDYVDKCNSLIVDEKIEIGAHGFTPARTTRMNDSKAIKLRNLSVGRVRALHTSKWLFLIDV